jgi:hypothetical protein
MRPVRSAKLSPNGERTTVALPRDVVRVTERGVIRTAAAACDAPATATTAAVARAVAIRRGWRGIAAASRIAARRRGRALRRR